MRAKISFGLKAFTILIASLGVTLSLIFAERDGYSSSASRLLYFTAISNIWMVAMFCAMLVLPRIKSCKSSTRVKNTLYVLRFIFTVSITLTGFIFCAVLAPGAKNANYNAWTHSSVLTHVAVPLLSIADMFVDPYRIKLTKMNVLLCTLPPFIYLIFASALVILKVDFGRGDPYPYVFLNYYSPAGVFGFSDEMPYIFGSFYWIILILFGILGIGFLYRKIYNKNI